MNQIRKIVLKFQNWLYYHRYDYPFLLWFDAKEQLSERMFPRQRWLTKRIPRRWMDKTELIPEVLFATLIHFVEQEDGLQVMAYQVTAEINSQCSGDETPDLHRLDTYRTANRELTVAYRWAIERSARLQEIDDTLVELMENQYIKNRRQLHENIQAAEEQWKRADLDALSLIVKHHRLMFT